MGVAHWLGQNWPAILQSAGILAGLIFTALSFRLDVKARRISNLIAITDHHRDLWEQLFRRPDLSRILDAAADLEKSPIRTEEELFVTLLVLHLSSVYQASKAGMFVRVEGLRADIQQFFSLPIPTAVWTKVRGFQEQRFVRFVESCWPEETTAKPASATPRATTNKDIRRP